MEELIKYLKETQMEGLKGMKIEGEIPVTEKQLNVLLEQFVRPQLEPKPGTEPTSPPAASANPMMELLPYLKFPILDVKIKDGKLILKVRVEV
ncbi:hypothetical protein [Flavilitoribacter nigricans]|uniref:Uncharacterized protein n=1 Tax=Flavilitoribacter nigricans (strain ATCC 23147 / DSM 23189 / NBRC 102662 / NCIMB 1420 / SS-2) TaxID=1122177 RepID=A0A2D0NHN0_FLAN2|nr:hypothetical protein [Flavilitoribacter nigricans]PHN07987.1 hypothetical protein CRP01_04325 [Flavilitoribacter nigricans DSM 23189 = NBRC 102662]